MTIERALYSLLTTTPGLTAYWGRQVYPETAPTDRLLDLPYATYSQAGETPVHSLGGFASLTNARITLDVWTATQPQREGLAATLQTTLNAWAPAISENVAIRRSAVIDQVDTYIPPTDGSERGVYQRTLDLDIWYRDL